MATSTVSSESPLAMVRLCPILSYKTCLSSESLGGYLSFGGVRVPLVEGEGVAYEVDLL